MKKVLLLIGLLPNLAFAGGSIGNDRLDVCDVEADHISVTSMTGVTSITFTDGRTITSTAADTSNWNTMENIPADIADGDDVGEAGGGVSYADFIVHTTTDGTRDSARSNVVYSSSTRCHRIHTVETAVATVTITPTAVDSTIKVVGNFGIVKDQGATSRVVVYKLRRGVLSTDAIIGPLLAAQSMAVSASSFSGVTVMGTDEPGTTNAVTYTIRANTVVGLSSYTFSNMLAEEIPKKN